MTDRLHFRIVYKRFQIDPVGNRQKLLKDGVKYSKTSMQVGPFGTARERPGLNQLAASLNDSVLLIVRANGCGACDLMKRNWAQIEKEIKARFPQLHIVIIDLDSTGARISTSLYPFWIKNLILGYPNLALIPRADWDHAMANIPLLEKNPITFIGTPVLDGRWNGQILQRVMPPEYHFYFAGGDGTKKGIIDWILSVINPVAGTATGREDFRSKNDLPQPPILDKRCGGFRLAPYNVEDNF